MSADRLREAAKVLRERAEAASEGPWWDIRAGLPGTDAEWIVDSDPTFIASTHIDSDRGKSDATYIATMHPGVGLALADWLDADADLSDDMDMPCEDEAVRLAGLILGSKS